MTGLPDGSTGSRMNQADFAIAKFDYPVGAVKRPPKWRAQASIPPHSRSSPHSKVVPFLPRR